MIDDLPAALLDPDAPVHPPDGMSVEDCLAYRGRLANFQRQSALVDDEHALAGRRLTRAQLDAEDRARARIEEAEDRREGRG